MYCIRTIYDNFGTKFDVHDVREVRGVMYLKVQKVCDMSWVMIKIKNIKLGYVGISDNGLTQYYVFDVKVLANPNPDKRVWQLARIGLIPGGMLRVETEKFDEPANIIHVSQLTFGQREYNYPLKEIAWSESKEKFMVVKMYLDKYVVRDINWLMLKLYLRVWNMNRMPYCQLF